jgi:hypothetical protein
MKQTFRVPYRRRIKKLIRTEPDGRQVWYDSIWEDGVADIELSVDVEGLARELGPTAAYNKGGIAREAGGLVTAKAIRRIPNAPSGDTKTVAATESGS